MKMYNIVFLFLNLFFFSCKHSADVPKAAQLTDSLHIKKTSTAATTGTVLRSADGGQTWQDISNGLAEPALDEYVGGRNFFYADDNGLYLTDRNWIYHSNTNATAPYWTKAPFPNAQASIIPGKNGIFAYHSQAGVVEKTNGSNVWSPVFTHFKDKRVRSVFETATGTLLVSTDMGLYKSTNSGKTWKQLPAGGLGAKTVEANGVLLTTGNHGIMRSTDDGESWFWVIKEGGVGVDVERIPGGFAAINYSTAAGTRRVRTSYDGGQTWQPIDAGMPGQVNIDAPLQPIKTSSPALNSADSAWHPAKATPSEPIYITSVIQVGENFFCGRSDGIYRSSDKGKTWQCVRCVVKGKMFKLAVSGYVIYAIQTESHC